MATGTSHRPSGNITGEYLAAHPRAFNVLLRHGRHARIRPIVAADREALAQAFNRLSPRSRYLRFHRQVSELSGAELAALAAVDQDTHVAWGAVAIDEPGRPGVGAARFLRLPDDPTTAEVHVAVVDDWQGMGLGRILLQTVLLAAVEAGVERLVAKILPDNEPAIRMFCALGAETVEQVDGSLRLVIPVTNSRRMLRLSDSMRV